MGDRVELTGEVKHNNSGDIIEKNIGFWLDRKSGNRLLKALDYIIPKSTRLRNKWLSMPLTDDDVGDWNEGDKVKITIERVE